MVRITLPDGSQREFQGPVSVSEVANSIGTGLGRAALAGRVGTPGTESRLVDTSYVIDQDSHLAIITAKEAPPQAAIKFAPQLMQLQRVILMRKEVHAQLGLALLL